MLFVLNALVSAVVIGVAAAAPVQDVVDLVQRTGKSRFPVYEQTLDQVVGVITVIEVMGQHNVLQVPVITIDTTAEQLGLDELEGWPNSVSRTMRGTRNHAIGMAHMDHHRAKE